MATDRPARLRYVGNGKRSYAGVPAQDFIWDEASAVYRTREGHPAPRAAAMVEVLTAKQADGSPPLYVAEPPPADPSKGKGKPSDQPPADPPKET